MRPGQRVRVTGIPYEDRVGVITSVDDDRKTAWDVWVRLDGMTRSLGFGRNEVLPEVAG